jgi:colanic acid/amylovoran biosynthesis glycosyltransferase
MKPLVLHSVYRYLPLTETWIYGQIQAISEFRQAVICVDQEQPERFPFAPIVSMADHAAVKPLRHAARAIAPLTGHPARRYDRLLAPWYRFAWPLLATTPLQAWAPRVIHAHFGDHATRTLGLKAATNAPMVTTFYGYDLALAREPFWRNAYARLFREGECFLVEGHAMARTLAEIGCPPSKIHVQHLGVDLDAIPFSPRAPEAVCRVLIAASFREKKGIPQALEAYAKVLSSHPGKLSLTIIGDGPLREALHAQARSLGLFDAIRWLGYQPHAVFLEEARNAHVFLHPSITASDGDTEGGAPVSILEAQATGLPVVATRHADIPEVTHPDSAELVPERDVDALADALARVALHPQRWAAMGEAGRRHVAAEYDVRHQGIRLEGLYHSLIRQKATGRLAFD